MPIAPLAYSPVPPSSEVDNHEVFYRSHIRVLIAKYLGNEKTSIQQSAFSYHPLTDRRIWPTVFPVQILSHSSLTKGLELNFARFVCSQVNVHEKIGFIDYLKPNEANPGDIQPHLSKMSRGLIVSAGTERSIYDLLLSPEGMCTGLVVRDINPRVKAYIDFLILLVRIASSREEFVALSEKPSEEEFDSRIEEIRSKIYASDIPETMKKYYLHHLVDFATVYFPQDHLPEHGDNSPVDYRKSDALFAKLQHFAKAGNIIATRGDIGDLEFLGTRPISIVDTSNICDYITLDLRGRGIFHPRVIWTIPFGEQTRYYSYVHENIDKAGRITIDKCISIIFGSGLFKLVEPGRLINNEYLVRAGHEPFNSVPRLSYFPRVPAQLISDIQQHFIHCQGLGWIGFHPASFRFTMGGLGEATPEQVHRLTRHPSIHKHVNVLVKLHEKLRPEIYIAFMHVPGWKEAFEDLCKRNMCFKDKRSLIQVVLLKIQESGLFQSFTLQFGDERLLALHKQCHPPTQPPHREGS